MADIFSSLIFTCKLGTSFLGRFVYETQTPKRKHSLMVYFMVSAEPSAPPTMDSVFELLKDEFVKRLAGIQSNEVRWTTVDLALLDHLNSPTGFTYRKRYSGLYGSQKLGRVNPNKVFRYELRSMPVDSSSGTDTKVDSVAIEQSYSRRMINIRGVPESFEFYDRDNLSQQEQVDAISHLFVGEMAKSKSNLKLRVRMSVEKSSQPVRLQQIVSTDPIGLVNSPLRGKNRIS